MGKRSEYIIQTTATEYMGMTDGFLTSKGGHQPFSGVYFYIYIVLSAGEHVKNLLDNHKPKYIIIVLWIIGRL